MPLTDQERVQDVVVTQPFIGICHMQVCAYGEVPPALVEKRANELNPSGVRSNWTIVWEPENVAPTPCADEPTRLHYLLSC